MKILMLTPYLPYPLLSGGQTRSYNLLKNLASDHEITLFSFIRVEKEIKYKKELLRFCKNIEVFKRRPAWSLFNIILSAITPYPFLVAIYLSRTVRKALEMELGRHKYDLIHAETFYVMPNIPKTKIPILLVEQTIEYQVYKHFVENSISLMLKPFLWVDVMKVKYWEKHFWARSNRVIAMSQADRDKMIKALPGLTVNVVPNGVDLGLFEDKKVEHGEEKTILYVGNFKWLQNREAVMLLLKKVWPKLKKRIPNVRLWIVGRGSGKLKIYGGPAVNFDENVNDIRDAYKNADLILAPIKGPGGTRLKILEAMASGCPVVTTPVGIEGIDATHDKEVLVGETTEQLTDYAIKILRDKNLRQKLIRNSKELVKNHYDWINITNKLGKIYQEVGYGKKS